MILIPERETVLILPPRTASGSLYRTVLATYPKAIMPYRHMEADGVPAGYDFWPKVGMVREPVARMWSLYKFLQKMEIKDTPAQVLRTSRDADWTAAQRASVEKPFEHWLLNNQMPFSCPYVPGHEGKFLPQFTVKHAIPENRKSQYLYLRPDLGTEVYNDLGDMEKRLGVKVELHANKTPESRPPALSQNALDYVGRVFAWDKLATRRNSY